MSTGSFRTGFTANCWRGIVSFSFLSVFFRKRFVSMALRSKARYGVMEGEDGLAAVQEGAMRAPPLSLSLFPCHMLESRPTAQEFHTSPPKGLFPVLFYSFSFSFFPCIFLLPLSLFTVNQMDANRVTALVAACGGVAAGRQRMAGQGTECVTLSCRGNGPMGFGWRTSSSSSDKAWESSSSHD